ncbi:MAG: hypothetical protein ACOH5I_19695 [Oligoflexus sp.]
MQARHILLLLLNLSLWQSAARASDYWPLGTNVCRGTWSYDERTSCAHSSHGNDLKKPIRKKDGEACGYEAKVLSCWHGDKFSKTIQSARQHLTRKDHGWHAHELQNHCQALAMTTKVGKQERIASATAVDVYASRRCYSRRFKKCQKWHQDVQFTCKYTVHTKEYKANATECGTTNDHKKPKTCTVGYNYKVKVSNSCPNVSRTTGLGYDISSTMKKAFHTNFSCSTGDNLPSTTQSETQKKFQFLQARLESMPDANHSDHPHILDSMNVLLEEKGDWLTDSQQFNADRILNTNMTRALPKAPNRLFDARRDCAASSDGRFRWYCLNPDFEMRDLRFSERAYLSNYDLTYQFTCNRTSQAPTVKLSRGEKINFLAARPGAIEQTLTITDFVSDVKLSFHLDIRSKITGDCIFDLIAFEPVLDIDRVEEKVSTLTDRFLRVKDNIILIRQERDLPAVFSAIGEMKKILNTRINEELFNCSDLESLTPAGLSLCPVMNDPVVLCEISTGADNHELAESLNALKNDACLLLSLQDDLPNSELCREGSNTLCFAGMQRVLRTLEAEMNELKVEVYEVAAYLETWKNVDRALILARGLQDLLNDSEA